VLVVLRKVWDGLVGFKLCFHSVEEVGNMGMELNGNLVQWWLLVRADDEQLVGVVFIFTVGKEHMGINIPLEVLGALPKLLWLGGKLWLQTKVGPKVQSKTEQGMVVGGRDIVSTKVVVCKVTGAVV
jgi:hypothetical protein